MAPFDRPHTGFYPSFIVTMYLFILPLLGYSASNIGVTFKSGLGVVHIACEEVCIKGSLCQAQTMAMTVT